MNGINTPKIFLAGAAGMLGTAIIRHVLESFPEVCIRTAYNKSPLNIIDSRLKPIQVDLASREACINAAKGCSHAIMAAATTFGAALTKEYPWLQVNKNLILNAEMLEAFHVVGIRRVVFISSSTVYQEHEGSIKEEELDLNQEPHPAYIGVGWVMRALEKLCLFWHRQTGMEVIIARAANIYGPFARFDPLTSNVLPALIRKASDRINPFDLWGSPEIARDLLYADDAARAVSLMLLRSDSPFEIFNMASGTAVTVREMLETVLETAGYSPEIRYHSNAPTTIPFRRLDCNKAAQLLGWRAETDLREGVAKTYRWWIENRERWKR